MRNRATTGTPVFLLDTTEEDALALVDKAAAITRCGWQGAWPGRRPQTVAGALQRVVGDQKRRARQSCVA